MLYTIFEAGIREYAVGGEVKGAARAGHTAGQNGRRRRTGKKGKAKRRRASSGELAGSAFSGADY